MSVVWRYGVRGDDETTVHVPAGSVPLRAGIAGSSASPAVWCLVPDREADTVPMVVRVVGTGWELDGDVGDYLNTFTSHGDVLVWHAFVRFP